MVCLHFSFILFPSFLVSDLERKLKTAAEAVDQHLKDKRKLETDISEMMKQSGDSSAQLTKMNEDLMQKERYSTSRNIEIQSCNPEQNV